MQEGGAWGPGRRAGLAAEVQEVWGVSRPGRRGSLEPPRVRMLGMERGLRCEQDWRAGAGGEVWEVRRPGSLVAWRERFRRPGPEA